MDAGNKILAWLLADEGRSFTIREAADGADVAATAMRSFFERNRTSFEPLGRDETGERGGPAMRYRLTEEGATSFRSRLPRNFVAPPRVAPLPSGLLNALTQLVEPIPADAPARTRARTIRLARHLLTEEGLDRTRRVVAALDDACHVLLELVEHEQMLADGSAQRSPHAYLRNRVVKAMQSLDAVDQSRWASLLGQRAFTSRALEASLVASAPSVRPEPAAPARSDAPAVRAVGSMFGFPSVKMPVPAVPAVAEPDEGAPRLWPAPSPAPSVDDEDPLIAVDLEGLDLDSLAAVYAKPTTNELLARARTELDAGRLEEALESARRAADHAPSDLEPLMTLAGILERLDRTDEASSSYGLLAELAQSQQRPPAEIARFHYQRGAALEKLGHRILSIDAFEEAFRYDPEQLESLRALGRIYFEDQQWEKARRIFRRLAKQAADATAYLALGQIHLRLDDAAEARKSFERGLAVDPGDERLVEALAMMDA